MSCTYLHISFGRVQHQHSCQFSKHISVLSNIKSILWQPNPIQSNPIPGWGYTVKGLHLLLGIPEVADVIVERKLTGIEKSLGLLPENINGSEGA